MLFTHRFTHTHTHTNANPHTSSHLPVVGDIVDIIEPFSNGLTDTVVGERRI